MLICCTRHCPAIARSGDHCSYACTRCGSTLELAVFTDYIIRSASVHAACVPWKRRFCPECAGGWCLGPTKPKLYDAWSI